MSLSFELRLRLLRDFTALCGIGALIFGAGHIAAAFGSDWGYVGEGSTRKHVVMGLVMLGAGLVCTWVRLLASRELARRAWMRRERLARELGTGTAQNVIDALGGRSETPHKPRHV